MKIFGSGAVFDNKHYTLNIQVKFYRPTEAYCVNLKYNCKQNKRDLNKETLSNSENKWTEKVRKTDIINYINQTWILQRVNGHSQRIWFEWQRLKRICRRQSERSWGKREGKGEEQNK